MSLWFSTGPPSPETLTALGFAYTEKMEMCALDTARGEGTESIVLLPGSLAPRARCPPRDSAAEGWPPPL